LRICRRSGELRVALAGAQRPVGFVPTMGALHEGHAALFRQCREECATVVASVFVNPLQFDQDADLQEYPRTEEADFALCEQQGVQVVFVPNRSEIYPDGFATAIDVGPVAAEFEGALRAGHFSGVATVVMKLLHLVAPDRAYFGQKDAQQLCVIQTLVRDLDVPVEIVPVETVREPDGLARSSRNVRLSMDDRPRAAELHRGLVRARNAWDSGERDPNVLAAAARHEGLEYDYCACVDPETFRALRERVDGSVRVIVAARLGPVRLIDNLLLT